MGGRRGFDGTRATPVQPACMIVMSSGVRLYVCMGAIVVLLNQAWDDIPHGVDVLITHATPAGHGPEGLGDPQLTRAIKIKRPRVVVSGLPFAAAHTRHTPGLGPCVTALSVHCFSGVRP